MCHEITSGFHSLPAYLGGICKSRKCITEAETVDSQNQINISPEYNSVGSIHKMHLSVLLWSRRVIEEQETFMQRFRLNRRIPILHLEAGQGEVKNSVMVFSFVANLPPIVKNELNEIFEKLFLAYRTGEEGAIAIKIPGSPL